MPLRTRPTAIEVRLTNRCVVLGFGHNPPWIANLSLSVGHFEGDTQSGLTAEMPQDQVTEEKVMRRLLTLVVVLFAAVLANAVSTKELADDCKEAQKLMVATGTVDQGYHTGFCIGMLMGWSDTADKLSIYSNEDKVYKVMKVSGFRLRELIDEFVQYVEENPKAVDKPWDQVVASAATRRGWLTFTVPQPDEVSSNTPTAQGWKRAAFKFGKAYSQ